MSRSEHSHETSQLSFKSGARGRERGFPSFSFPTLDLLISQPAKQT
uniref:Uncharacterized protein n=1 Tax=Anguilla anguilla TaxID=7936 RepID=A0A0E9XM77_ANGAN